MAVYPYFTLKMMMWSSGWQTLKGEPTYEKKEKEYAVFGAPMLKHCAADLASWRWSHQHGCDIEPS